jgi:hypothetical protein
MTGYGDGTVLVEINNKPLPLEAIMEILKLVDGPVTMDAETLRRISQAP